MEDTSSRRSAGYLDGTSRILFRGKQHDTCSTGRTETGNLDGSDILQVDSQAAHTLPKSKIDRIEYEDGRVYTGGLFHGTPHGIGQMVLPDGSSYYGNFQFGLKHGQGHQIFSEKSEFKGPFCNGLKMGKGLYKSSSEEDWQEVEYVNDIKKQ